MAYNPQDEYEQARKYAEELNKVADITAAPQIANIQGQIADVPNVFNPYRNAAEVQSRIDAKTLAEQMANTGLTRSGTNLTAQTALQTTKQNTLNTINQKEMAAKKDLVAQLNAYIAQRDATKQQNLATAQQQAYQNVSDYTRTTSLAEINQQYAQENARINNEYNMANTRLADELATAREDKNWAREAELTRQQAELNRQHDINMANINNQAAMARQKATATRSGGGTDSKQATAFGKELAASIKAVSAKDAQYNKDNLTSINNKNNAEYNAVIQIIKTYGNDPASFEAAITSAGLLNYWTQISANPSVKASMIDQALHPEAYTGKTATLRGR